MKKSLISVLALLTLSSLAQAQGGASGGTHLLENGDAYQLGQLLEGSGITPIIPKEHGMTLGYKFYLAYNISCEFDTQGAARNCYASPQGIDPALGRSNVDPKAMLPLLAKAGYKHAEVSDVSDGTAGEAFLDAGSAQCEINLDGPAFYSRCKFDGATAPAAGM